MNDVCETLDEAAEILNAQPQMLTETARQTLLQLHAYATQLQNFDAHSVTFKVGHNWPTPNNCIRVSEAMDKMMPARYGEILRAYAAAEEARFTKHGPIPRD